MGGANGLGGCCGKDKILGRVAMRSYCCPAALPDLKGYGTLTDLRVAWQLMGAIA
jgi:hypothetical protein